MSRHISNTLPPGRRMAAASVIALGLALAPLAAPAFELVEAQQERDVSLTVGTPTSTVKPISH